MLHNTTAYSSFHLQPTRGRVEVGFKEQLLDLTILWILLPQEFQLIVPMCDELTFELDILLY